MSLESAPYPCTARVCQLALTVSMNAGRNTSVDPYGLTPETRSAWRGGVGVMTTGKACGFCGFDVWN